MWIFSDYSHFSFTSLRWIGRVGLQCRLTMRSVLAETIAQTAMASPVCVYQRVVVQPDIPVEYRLQQLDHWRGEIIGLKEMKSHNGRMQKAQLSPLSWFSLIKFLQAFHTVKWIATYGCHIGGRFEDIPVYNRGMASPQLKHFVYQIWFHSAQLSGLGG